MTPRRLLASFSDVTRIPSRGRRAPSPFLTSLPPYFLSSKSFRCNTYRSPRKCCKQKTYGTTKFFRCNTYKNSRGYLPQAKYLSPPPASGRPDVFQNYPLSFQTLAHSFARSKNSTPFFSSDSALFAKNHPGWGYDGSIDDPRRSEGKLL